MRRGVLIAVLMLFGGVAAAQPEDVAPLEAGDVELATDEQVADLFDRLAAEHAAWAGHMPSLHAAAAEYKVISEETRDRWRDEDRWPEIELFDVMEGAWPRAGAEAALDLIASVEASGVPGHIGAFMRLEPKPERWPRGVTVTKARSERLDFMRPCRYLMKVWAARMRIAAVEGRREDAAQRFEEMLAVANAARARLSQVDRLFGTAVAEMAMGELRAEIVEGLHDEASLRRCLAALDRTGMGPPLSATLELEAGFGQNFLAEYMTNMKKDDPRIPAGRIVEELEGARERAAELQREPIAYKGTKHDDQTPIAIMADAWDVMMKPPPAEEVLATISRAMVAEVGWSVHNAISVRGTRVMLAIELERLTKGRLPESLEALTPGWLAELPTDPLTGEPFKYRREGSGKGETYVLYSVGVDLADDGGRSDAEKPSLAMDRGGAGMDLVLNCPRSLPRKPAKKEDEDGPPKF